MQFFIWKLNFLILCIKHAANNGAVSGFFFSLFSPPPLSKRAESRADVITSTYDWSRPVNQWPISKRFGELIMLVAITETKEELWTGGEDW